MHLIHLVHKRLIKVIMGAKPPGELSPRAPRAAPIPARSARGFNTRGGRAAAGFEGNKCRR